MRSWEMVPETDDDRASGDMGVSLVGLAVSTIWLFFGPIDWRRYNAVKDLMTSRTSPGDDEHPSDSAAGG